MERKNWILLAIDFAQEKGLSPVQLQKSLFLIGKELPEEVGKVFYGFNPHNYGPFSQQVYTDAEELAEGGLVVIERPAGSYAMYRITGTGSDQAKSIMAEANKLVVAYLKDVVTWVQGQTFSSLIRSIYSKYPEYRLNSVFQY